MKEWNLSHLVMYRKRHTHLPEVNPYINIVVHQLYTKHFDIKVVPIFNV